MPPKGKKGKKKGSGSAAASPATTPAKSADEAKANGSGKKGKKSGTKLAAEAVKSAVQRVEDSVHALSLSPKKRKMMYFFGDGGTPSDMTEAKKLLGGKGAGLATMTRLGLPVPSGFTITTEVCVHYMKHSAYPDGYKEMLDEQIARVEKAMGRKFGSIDRPLLLSVRSGARVSMPGMMDTILNLGLNDKAVEGLAKESGSERFAWDCYRRFIAMYGEIAKGIHPATKKDRPPFDSALDEVKEAAGVDSDVELTADHLKEVVKKYKAIYEKHVGEPFPNDPHTQLFDAITAVFASWNNDRAIAYRRMNAIPEEWGTACNVQSMVFGNFGDTSATGVAFTRDPATGNRVFYGEYLKNAQGEDVVAGLRTPQPINANTKTNDEQKTLEEEFPEVYGELDAIQKKLENYFRNMQDLEFTIMQGKLYMLQTRDGKRTARAAFKMAADMVEEGLITKGEAIRRIDAEALNQFLRPLFDGDALKAAHKEGRLVASGLPAGPGAASGTVVFSSSDAVEAKKKGQSVILVRVETSPEDIKGMDASEGIVTARGGMTSHAALVGRQMGKVAVVGAESLIIDYQKATIKIKGNDKILIKAGDQISIDGSKGHILTGHIATKQSEVLQVKDGTLDAKDSDDFKLFAKILHWADEFRRLHIRMNADQADQASNGLFFGAEGIGLCRTEHMFFGADKIQSVREFIIANDDESRKKAFDKLLPLQKADFKNLFSAMGSRPVNIRLLDPPLHEFVPHTEKEIKELHKFSGVAVADIKARCEAIKEANPMLGHRGCRLAITAPELPAMQTRAIVEAALDVQTEQNLKVDVEIMVPMVSCASEFSFVAKIIRKTIADVCKERDMDQKRFNVKVGTMIETPRACLVADDIAKDAEFFSAGTNDLTQSTFLLSRDDAGSFLPAYLENGVLAADPFAALDKQGPGELLRIAVQKGRGVREDIHIGICGEHGGHPASINFCHEIGLDYVSCSPFRVPIARVAAAQAALEEEHAKEQKLKHHAHHHHYGGKYDS